MPGARVGAILPHAPLLILDDARSGVDVARENVRTASREVARVLGPPLVIVSPHAARTGVYASTRGGLRGFGVRRADAPYEPDKELSARVAARWRRPVLDEPVDHGVVVPLELLGWNAPLVAIGIAEDERDGPEASASLAEVLRTIDVHVVASVNGGAGVTARAPLTELPDGLALEEELRDVLEQDVAGLARLAPRLAQSGGSCSLGPLLVFAHVFGGVAMEVLAHEWPVGVGYPVAVTKGTL